MAFIRSGQKPYHMLAQKLEVYQPAIVVTSKEVKAQQTGAILAEQLQLPRTQAADLHEHDRRNMGYTFHVTRAEQAHAPTLVGCYDRTSYDRTSRVGA